MKTIAAVALFTGGVALGLVASAAVPNSSSAELQQHATKCKWPAKLDAVAAAPANHKVVLENEHVRVLDVTVRPGEREKVHAHCLRSVMYLMHEGKYRDYDGSGKLIEEVTTPPAKSKFPMTLWLEPQAPHSVHNTDVKPTRLLRVELKS